MKKKMNMLTTIILIIFILISFSTNTFAKPAVEVTDSGTGSSTTSSAAQETGRKQEMYVDTNDYKINEFMLKVGVKGISEMSGKIITIIQTFGTAIALIGIIVIGIKYMLGSIEQKAEYKKSMVPYVVGCVFIFTISTIVGIIGTIASQL